MIPMLFVLAACSLGGGGGDKIENTPAGSLAQIVREGLRPRSLHIGRKLGHQRHDRALAPNRPGRHRGFSVVASVIGGARFMAPRRG